MKSRYILIIALIIIGFFGYRWYSSQATPPIAPPIKVVEVTPVQARDIRESISLIGTIQPKQNTQLLAKTAGTLTLLVSPGQKVTKGTLLAKINNAHVVQDQQLSSNSVAIAKSQYERMLILIKKGYVSAKEVEDKKQSWIQAQINLSKAKTELDAMHYYAPFTGVVGALKMTTGSQVALGDAILNVYNPSSLNVKFDIPCVNTQTVHAGSAVMILNKQYMIQHMQNLLDQQSHMCPADVDIECSDCLLGNSVPVDLVVQEKKQALVIPFQALIIHEGKQSVYTVEHNKLTLKPVTTGIQDKDQIEITAGLTQGELLITHGQERMMAGMQVSVAKG